METLEHFGVYGACVSDDRLLCVKKHGGPYNGRYDLPGGSRKNGESLLDTLNREFAEETSYKIIEIYENSLFDTFVKINERQTVHHIFGIYDVKLEKINNIEEVRRYINCSEINDSLGEEWVAIKDLTEKNSSPLILKVLATQREFQAKKYDEWKIL
ncbi:NUDIX domain-containing protein [Streptococcus henryi]|uniref:NUDIX domain-containing protein n=1 Tax=Streptococcus henryi TaxID=439219 RepID=A0A1G6AY17_9STRE|nr:NUDIX domain-containing protein [Streptococcus henryi]SDB13307.1 NUDIX domain-containing protein [Streptococcus henryi]